MRTKKKIFIAILGAEGVMIAVFIVLICYFSSDAIKVNRRMEFAQRYLLDEDYERAIAAFDRIIEMDSDNADAYIGMAEAYAEISALDQTVEILEKGAQWVKKSDSYEIQAMLDRYTEELEQLRASQETDSEMAEASQQQEPAEPTADPDVQPEEVTSVNTGFITQDGELYYYDALGSLVVGWFEVDGSRYYAGADGRIYRNGEYEVDSVKYRFGQEGICVEEVKDEAWKQAYIDCLHELHEDYMEFLIDQSIAFNIGSEYSEDRSEYNFIYIDDDDIPEIAVYLGGYGPRSTCGFIYYSNGKADEYYVDGTYGFSYMERKNIFSYLDGNLMFESGASEEFAKLVDGQIIEIAGYEVKWKENSDELVFNVNGVEVSEEEFDKEIIKIPYVYDEASGPFPEDSLYTYEQILDLIRNY